MSSAMTSEALPRHRVRGPRLKPATMPAVAIADHDLQQWQEDGDCIPIAAHVVLVDPLVETRALLSGIESMVALNFKGAQADAVLCMVGTAQKQVAAALAVLDRHTRAE